MSDAEKKRIQLEIARLSGAIHRHTHNANYHPYKPAYPPARGHSRGRVRGAASTRGRGRGGRGAYTLDLRAQNQAVSTPPTGAGPSAQAGPDTEKEEGEIEPDPPVQPAASWIKTARSGHRSLMTAEKRAQLQANAVYKTSTSKSSTSLKPPGKGRRPILNIKAVPVPDSTPRVFIDGVTYEFNPGGKGLKRTSDYKQPNTLQWYIDSPKPKLVSVLGIKYRFQPNGDLTLPKSNVPRKGQLCPYFSKTGRCRKGHICKAIHDPDRVAACPNFLRGRCELGPICPLSHNPSAHNTPSCTRFQALSYCTRPNCPYPHVKVSNDAPICEDFAFTGWCDTAEGECPYLHSYDCPEFWSTGKCPRGAKCKLRHTLRAEKGRAAKPETTKEAAAAVSADKKGKKTGAVPGSFEEQTEFIVFDDEGSPGLALSESEEDDEEENDDDDEDEDEDEEEEDGNGDGHGKQEEASADEKDESDEDVKILF
ncbi:hypothetical protein I312_106296 [Cryptococcus bacillisporus CA1280]|uniref:CCCH zinc finger protein n=1 Tax=Cryptococcus bacillisporus CA1280 TaxID=1296109 RepID=A0A0D0U9J8_CRYGA|nr:CCCH zinc finger protein [Cryptococcus bacillisporus CA1280]